MRPLIYVKANESGELIHRIVFTASLQGSISREVLLVIVADVRTRHVLVLDARDAITNLLALHVQNIAQHAQFTEVLLGKVSVDSAAVWYVGSVIR